QIGNKIWYEHKHMEEDNISILFIHLAAFAPFMFYELVAMTGARLIIGKYIVFITEEANIDTPVKGNEDAFISCLCLIPYEFPFVYCRPDLEFHAVGIKPAVFFFFYLLKALIDYTSWNSMEVLPSLEVNFSEVGEDFTSINCPRATSLGVLLWDALLLKEAHNLACAEGHGLFIYAITKCSVFGHLQDAQFICAFGPLVPDEKLALVLIHVIRYPYHLGIWICQNGKINHIVSVEYVNEMWEEINHIFVKVAH
ncbi:hypothetical protein ACJX0J_006071, partial [Zea mays]